MIISRALAVNMALAFGGCFASAQSRDLPPNTIDCTAFTKLPNGNWHVGARTSFNFGNTKQILQNQDIRPHFLFIRAFDFYEVLERKCGGQK